jgi:uncharacterized protein YggU (UPF0235/DUF167 family)
MLIKVKVLPGSQYDEVEKRRDDEFVIRVKNKAQEGKANKRAKEILASYFNIPEDRLVLLRGVNQRNKIFKIYL